MRILGIIIVVLCGIVVVCCAIVETYSYIQLRKSNKLLEDLKADREKYLRTGKM